MLGLRTSDFVWLVTGLMIIPSLPLGFALARVLPIYMGHQQSTERERCLARLQILHIMECTASLAQCVSLWGQALEPLPFNMALFWILCLLVPFAASVGRVSLTWSILSNFEAVPEESGNGGLQPGVFPDLLNTCITHVLMMWHLFSLGLMPYIFWELIFTSFAPYGAVLLSFAWLLFAFNAAAIALTKQLSQSGKATPVVRLGDVGEKVGPGQPRSPPSSPGVIRVAWQDTDDADDPTCFICLEEVGQNDEVFQLRCGHIFHAQCMRGWLATVLDLPRDEEVLSPESHVSTKALPQVCPLRCELLSSEASPTSTVRRTASMGSTATEVSASSMRHVSLWATRAAVFMANQTSTALARARYRSRSSSTVWPADADEDAPTEGPRSVDGRRRSGDAESPNAAPGAVAGIAVAGARGDHASPQPPAVPSQALRSQQPLPAPPPRLDRRRPPPVNTSVRSVVTLPSLGAVRTSLATQGSIPGPADAGVGSLSIASISEGCFAPAAAAAADNGSAVPSPSSEDAAPASSPALSEMQTINVTALWRRMANSPSAAEMPHNATICGGCDCSADVHDRTHCHSPDMGEESNRTDPIEGRQGLASLGEEAPSFQDAEMGEGSSIALVSVTSPGQARAIW